MKTKFLKSTKEFFGFWFLMLFLAIAFKASISLSAEPRIGLDLEWRPIEGVGGASSGGGKAAEAKTFTVNGVSFTMIRVPAGEFIMGSPTSEAGRVDNETQHSVRLTKDYWMGETEVTQGLWKAVMGNNPSHFSSCGEDCPVEKVSWDDCQEFIRKLNGMVSGGSFCLPTEAEWEYAARAGTTGSNAGDLDSMAWYGNNSGNKFIDALALWIADLSNYINKIFDNGCRTHPVAKKEPNGWGRYDMHGNVWEWCSDRYGDYSSGSVTDPSGPS